MTDRIINLTDYRTAGTRFLFDLPEDVMRIDRATPWGNPFPITRVRGRRAVIEAFRVWLRRRLMDDPTFLEPLRGKRLACWCAPEACHAEVILEVLDAPSIEAWLNAA